MDSKTNGVRIFTPTELGLNLVNLNALATTNGNRIDLRPYRSFSLVYVLAGTFAGTNRSQLRMRLYTPDGLTVLGAVPEGPTGIDWSTTQRVAGMDTWTWGAGKAGQWSGVDASPNGQLAPSPYPLGFVDFQIQVSVVAGGAATGSLWLFAE